jgi:formate hydrogenlyase subunit 5
MTAPAHFVAGNGFEKLVSDECHRAVPIGAYAAGNDIHYLFLDAGGVRRLSRTLGSDRKADAVSALVPLFSWDEREMRDEWDVRFSDLPDPRPFRSHDGVLPSAVTASGEGLAHFVVGPVHAGIIEPGRFTFSSGGETVVHLDAQLSYSHRGVERRLSGMSALDAARFVARVCGGCSASRSMAYAQALETLAGVSMDPWTHLARLVILELERLYNHLADIAACASAAGWMPGFARGMALKEMAMRVCALASGHRLLFDAIVPGGIGSSTLQTPDGVFRFMSALQDDVARYLDALFGNASVLARWRGAGTVSKEVARAFGIVGPARRSVGDDLDVRTLLPYGAYRALPANSALASSGDAYARCCVKRDEIRESFRLVLEALVAMRGESPTHASTFAIGAGTAAGAVEGARGIETVAIHVDDRGRLERIHIISASYRNWPVVARAMDGNIVPDFPLVNKSFNLCYACVDR